jgi:hypothetical protein
LLCNQYGEGRPYRTSHNAHRLAGQGERIELRMVASSWLEQPSFAASTKASDHIAVGIKDADGGYVDSGQILLSARLSKQGSRKKNGGRRGVFLVQDGKH